MFTAAEFGGKPIFPLSPPSTGGTTLPGCWPSLKHKFPAVFSLHLVPLLNSSLPRLAALILSEPLLTFTCQAGERFPDCSMPWPNPGAAGEPGHPQTPSPISRISLTDKVVTCLWTERWNPADYSLLSSTCDLFTWALQTQKWHTLSKLQNYFLY